jgi:molecular chaperone DnaJ
MASQRGRGGRERGADLRYNMEITLEEAFLGKTAQIEIPVSVTCESCSGTGAKAGTKPKTCSHCGGQGRIRQAQGFFTLERTCPGCQGRGQMIEDACTSCSGQGRVSRERTLSVNIPQGVETARAFASPAKARLASAAARPATSTFSSRCHRMSSSSATAPTCIAGCRSRW